MSRARFARSTNLWPNPIYVIVERALNEHATHQEHARDQHANAIAAYFANAAYNAFV